MALLPQAVRFLFSGEATVSDDLIPALEKTTFQRHRRPCHPSAAESIISRLSIRRFSVFGTELETIREVKTRAKYMVTSVAHSLDWLRDLALPL